MPDVAWTDTHGRACIKRTHGSTVCTAECIRSTAEAQGPADPGQSTHLADVPFMTASAASPLDCLLGVE